MSSKYQRYLASREWALKREAVRERSNNACERCRSAPQQAVHHMTYEHLGDEPLEDLLAVCDPCHAFLSAKSDDPRFDYQAWRKRRAIEDVLVKMPRCECGQIVCARDPRSVSFVLELWKAAS